MPAVYIAPDKAANENAIFVASDNRAIRLNKLHQTARLVRVITVESNCRICIVLVMALMFCVDGHTFGQRKGDVSLGFGFPELSNIRVRYKVYDQVRTGLSVGWFPRSSFGFGRWNNLVSFSGDLYYHFGRIIFNPGKRLFYVNTGINCLLEKPYQWNEKWWNSYLRVGGEIYSAYNFGVNIAGGVICNLNPEKNWARMDRILPAFGIDFFYRF
jgi:hypothetical protein